MLLHDIYNFCFSFMFYRMAEKDNFRCWPHSEYQIPEKAVQCLGEAAEVYIIGLMEDKNLFAIDTMCETIMPKDK